VTALAFVSFGGDAAGDYCGMVMLRPSSFHERKATQAFGRCGRKVSGGAEEAMRTTIADLKAMIGSGQFWRPVIRLGMLTAFVIGILAVAFFALLALIPLALIGGIAFHRLRGRVQQPARPNPRDVVIDGEYTVIDGRR
jgi:hypothetical protein